MFVRDLAMMCRTSGNQDTWCTSRRSAVQAASIDSPEKQRLTIEKFLQAIVHGSGATPTNVDALAKTKGGKKGGKGKEKGEKSKKFDGNRFW